MPECRREGQITDVMIGPVTEVRLAEFLNKSRSRRFLYTPVLEISATTTDDLKPLHVWPLSACQRLEFRLTHQRETNSNALTDYVDGTQVSPTVAA